MKGFWRDFETNLPMILHGKEKHDYLNGIEVRTFMSETGSISSTFLADSCFDGQLYFYLEVQDT